MVKNLFLPSLIIALGLLSGQAQQTNSMRQAFDEFKKAQAQDYQDFRRQANEKYGEFAEAAWKWFNADTPVPKPKDDPTPPLVVPDDDKEHKIPHEVPIDTVTVPPLPKPQPQPIAPVTPIPPKEEKIIEISYFGTPCKLRTGELGKLSISNSTNSELSASWSHLVNNADVLLSDCLTARHNLNLCDWAYYCLLEQATEQLYGSHTNQQALAMAYLFGNSGYALRLVRVNDRLYLFFGTDHMVYEMPGFCVGGLRYYTMGDIPERFEVYELGFPKEQPMSLLVPNLPAFAKAPTSNRQLKNNHSNGLDATVSTNKNLIDFFDTYPTSCTDDNMLTRWAMYANTPASDEMRESLYPGLRRQLDGLDLIEAVRRVLSWMQYAFEYGYDTKIWGGDRAFFPDETLYYPYQDCEDRAILFTRIVRDLIGLPCVLVYYPGHLASAVSFDDVGDVQGDYLMLNGRKFTICDPTYIGAPIGRTMPKMDNASAKAILLTMDKSFK